MSTVRQKTHESDEIFVSGGFFTMGSLIFDIQNKKSQ